MVKLSDETSVFVKDCVSFYHPTLGSVSGVLSSGGFVIRTVVCIAFLNILLQSDLMTEVYACIDMLLDLQQFLKMVPDTTVTHLHSDTLILAGQVVVPTSSIQGIATPSCFLVRWIAPVNFVRMDQQVFAF